jgi:hypothetical protein
VDSRTWIGAKSGSVTNHRTGQLPALPHFPGAALALAARVKFVGNRRQRYLF